MKLSIIIPVYNEFITIEKILNRVESAPLPDSIEKEIILVDDFSTDGTRELLRKLQGGIRKVFFHDKNQGKGAAVKTGYSNCTGDIVIVQDADLEYDPNEYSKLMKPILDGKADVVYGSRFIGGDSHRILYFWHSIGNKLLTLISNIFTDLNLTDMETCYKMLKREVIQKLHLVEERFGIEPEITAKIAYLAKKEKICIYEVGISYYGRTYEEGKKIGLKDAFRTLWCIWKFNSFTSSSKVIKYIANGFLVALFQILFLVLIVDTFKYQDLWHINYAYLVSIECTILFAFFLHSKFTWCIKFKSIFDLMINLLSFHIVTIGTTLTRFIIFYIMLILNTNYLVSSITAVFISLVLNYEGYDKLVFDKPILEPLLRKIRINRVIREIIKFDDCSLLDIGCGYNHELLSSVEKYLQTGIGIDPKAEELSIGKISTKKMLLDKKMPFGNNQFNIVTMLAVLEHLENPYEIVNEIARVLKPGGKLVITVPSRYSKPILEFLAFKIGIVSKEEISEHKKYYNKKDLYELVANMNDLKLTCHKYFQFGLNNYCIYTKV